jgi:hypothetical protein
MRRWLTDSEKMFVVVLLMTVGLAFLLRFWTPEKSAPLEASQQPEYVFAVKEPGHVSEENFALVRTGMERSEVDALLGRGHRIGREVRVESAGGGAVGLAETLYEEGEGEGRKRVYITFDMTRFRVREAEFLTEPTNPGHVTRENFAQVRVDMKRQEVDRLLGGEHRISILELPAAGLARMHPDVEITYQEREGDAFNRAIIRFRHRGVSKKDFQSSNVND